MFIKYLTDAEIETFMKEYVKKMHLEMQTCEEDCAIEVFNMDRDNSAAKFSTVIRSKTGSLKEDWLLTSFKVIKNGDNSMYEIKRMTKAWSRYLYSTLNNQDKELAQKFKTTFIDYIKSERDAQIQGARETYQDLVF